MPRGNVSDDVHVHIWGGRSSCEASPSSLQESGESAAATQRPPWCERLKDEVGEVVRKGGKGMELQLAIGMKRGSGTKVT